MLGIGLVEYENENEDKDEDVGELLRRSTKLVVECTWTSKQVTRKTQMVINFIVNWSDRQELQVKSNKQRSRG